MLGPGGVVFGLAFTNLAHESQMSRLRLKRQSCLTCCEANVTENLDPVLIYTHSFM